MDFNVEKARLSSCRVLREAKAEQSVDCDITLPDYCPDIKSVLSCSVEPGISGVDITGNRITAMGNGTVRLLYIGEDDKIACFEQNYPISKFVEMSSLPQEAAMLLSAKPSYINCRAVSPRRVDVHGCIAIVFSAVCCETAEIVSSACGDGLQLKQEPMQTCSAIGCVCKLFDMSEVVEINDPQCKPKSVLHAEALPLISETKTVSNKILIKGDLQLNICLCCENSEIKKIAHTMPISRIIELDGLNENSLCDVRLSTSSLDVKLQPDESGEMQRLDCAATLSAAVYGYSEVSCAVLLDSYSLKSCVELSQTTLVQEQVAATLNETFLLTSALDFSASTASSVLDFWCGDLTCVSSSSEESLELSGAVTLNILYKDREDKPCFTKYRLDYRHKKPIDTKNSALRYEPDIKISGVSVSGSGNELSARIQFTATGLAFSQKSRLAISDMTCEMLAAKCDEPAITVYFGDKGEEIWDIAKKYGTTLDAIRRRNALSCDALEENTMLIIPKVG